MNEWRKWYKDECTLPLLSSDSHFCLRTQNRLQQCYMEAHRRRMRRREMVSSMNELTVKRRDLVFKVLVRSSSNHPWLSVTPWEATVSNMLPSHSHLDILEGIEYLEVVWAHSSLEHINLAYNILLRWLWNFMPDYSSQFQIWDYRLRPPRR